MQRYFEIPFNHQDDLLYFLEKNKEKLLRYVKHILVAPFICDYKSTRHQEALKVINRDIYEMQIKRLQQAGYKVALLFNMPEDVDSKIFNYYINLKIDTFIVNNDKLANILHNRGKITIASITKRLQLNDIIKNDLSMYDYIVLDYTFNASFNRIQRLPENFKYILMVNTFCDFTCDFYSHWREKSNFICPKKINGYKNTTLINPMDYEKFDPYISIYKLQGREYHTEEICKDIMWYIFRNKKYDIGIDTSDPNYYYRYKGE